MKILHLAFHFWRETKYFLYKYPLLYRDLSNNFTVLLYCTVLPVTKPQLTYILYLFIYSPCCRSTMLNYFSTPTAPSVSVVFSHQSSILKTLHPSRVFQSTLVFTLPCDHGSYRIHIILSLVTISIVKRIYFENDYHY